MKNKIIFLLLIALTVLTSNSLAQPEKKSFSDLLGTRPTVDINLGTTMLGLLSSASENEDQGISNILSALKAINVTVFELTKDSNISKIRNEINNLADKKTNSGYEKLALIREEDSLVYIFANIVEGKLNVNGYAQDVTTVVTT